VALGHKPDGRTDLPWRAVAALKAVMGDEGLLQGVQFAVRRQSFDGRDLGAVLHDGEGQAGNDAPPIDEHRAGAALAVVATLLGSGEIEIFAECVEQGGPGPERYAAAHAVHT